MFRIVVVIFLTLVITSVLLAKTNAKYNYKSGYTVINGNKIYLEIADTPLLRELGLMYRANLDNEAGMLFIFDKPEKVTFWMKNVNFSLDMVFIKNNKIVKIEENVPSCKNESCTYYKSGQVVDSVLEVNSGFCKKHLLKVGQKFSFKNLSS